MQRILPMLIVAAICNGACSVKVSMYDPQAVAAADRWHVDFTYEAGKYEEMIGTDRGRETKVVKEGHHPVDLQLRDDIFFRLRDKYRIQTVRDVKEADALVRLHPLSNAYYCSYKSLDVLLTDKADKILARIRIGNGSRKPVRPDTEKFACFSADAIGKVIVDAKTHP